MLSAARTRVDAGVAGSTMTLSDAETAALVACGSRAMDCEMNRPGIAGGVLI